MSTRDNRAAALLTELAAQYIAIEAGRDTLITPIHTDVSSDRKNATIFVSVYPTEQGENALKFLMRHKDLFRSYLRKKAKLSMLPFIRFEIDYGEINRQNIEKISGELKGTIPEEES